jgi:pilus assembly protein CpaB
MNPIQNLFMLASRVPPRIMLVLILALAGVVTFLVTQEIERNRLAYNNAITELNYKPKGTAIVVTRDIPEGATISADCLEAKQIELSHISPDMLTDTSQALGRTAKFMITRDSYLSAHDLTTVQVTNSFQSKLREGERAITFAVDSTTGVAGFVLPDSHVDVIAQVGSGAETRSRPILSDVRVVAVGTFYQKNPADGSAQPVSSVTVAVLPTEAGKLINAMTAGRIYLTLRSDKDHTPVAIYDVNSLFSRQSQPAQTSLIPPPIPPLPPLAVVPEATTISAPEPQKRSRHEVEQWSGSAKNIAQVDQL